MTEVIHKALVVIDSQFDDVTQFLLDYFQQSGSDDNAVLLFQMSLDFGYQVLIERSLFRQQYHLRAEWEFGNHLDRQADHTEVSLQEVFAFGTDRLIALYSYRVAQLAAYLVRYIIRNTRQSGKSGRITQVCPIEAGAGTLPSAFELRSQRTLQTTELKDSTFRSLSKQCQPDLFGITVGITHTTGINPSAAVSAGSDVLEVTEDAVAQVGLQVLVGIRITGFGTGPYSVEAFCLCTQVKAGSLEVFVPVGILDDELTFGVDGLCRTNQQIGSRIIHQFDTEVRPGLASLCRSTFRALAGIEEEVVQDDFIKMLGGILCYLLNLCPAFGIGIAECLELAVTGYRISNTTGNLYILALKEFLGSYQRSFRGISAIPVRLDVNLIRFKRFGHFCPYTFQPLSVCHFTNITRSDVNRGFKAIVILCTHGHGEAQ